jgi:hypothetical protein
VTAYLAIFLSDDAEALKPILQLLGQQLASLGLVPDLA